MIYPSLLMVSLDILVQREEEQSIHSPEEDLTQI